MGDDDKKETDASRMSAPPPDYDDDDVTRLTPGDELARWRRIAAREETPALERQPEPPPSRPARPGAAPAASADDKTPARGIGPVESTPTRAISVPGFGDERPSDEQAVSRASLRDAPVSFPGQLPRGSSPPGGAGGRASAPPRLSPVPGARATGPAAASAPSGRPVGLTGSSPAGASEGPRGVFGSPSRGEPPTAPIALDARHGAAPGEAAPVAAPPPAAPSPAGGPAGPAFSVRGPEVRRNPALAPPPPSLSLPPRHEPSIPPAPPLGFDAPTAHHGTSGGAAASGGPGRVVLWAVAFVIVAAAIAGGVYLGVTGLGGLSLGGSPPTPGPVPTALPIAPPVVPIADPGAASAPLGPTAVDPVAEPAPTPPDPAAPVDPTAPPAPSAAGTPTAAELLASADAALRNGDAAAALEGYRAVVAAEPHDPYGYAGAARASLALGEAEDAISFASRAVAHRQRRASFRVLLGDAYEAHGEHARALEEWRAARELEPDNREAASRPTE